MMYRILALALYLMLVGACALLGTRLIVAIAPWRTTEALAIAVIAVGACLVIWRLANGRKRGRLAVTAVVALCAVLLGALHYYRFVTTYPPLASYRPTAAAAEPISCTGPAEPLLMAQRLLVEEEVLREAEMLMRSEYKFLAYESATLEPNLDWTETFQDDRSWNWHLHVMEYLITLARAYEITNDRRFLARAEELVLDWIDDNVVWLFDGPSTFAWNDHSTAFRAINWLYFLKVWRDSPLWSEAKEERILRVLLAHGRLLADDDFYTRKHNHGIDQDRALITLAVSCPGLRQANQWLNLGKRRLLEQVAFAVSPNGIHLEHSPIYHLIGLLQLRSLANFLDQADAEQELARNLFEHTERMAEFVPALVKPNGFLVQVGDTGTVPVTEYRHVLESFTRNPVVLQLARNGRTDLLSSHAAAWLDEGYAVVREFAEGSGSFEESLYLFFLAGAHEGRAHRQADDLSFVLAAGNKTLLVDPGVYSYKMDEKRSYVISASAHNTVVVDGASYRGWDTRIDLFESTASHVLIGGRHRNYSGIEHRRWLLYLRPNLLFVVDRIAPRDTASSRTHRFEQLFHFSPGSRVQIDKGERAATLYSDEAAGAPSLRISWLAPDPELRLYEGETEPMQGWHSESWGTLVPAPAVGAGTTGIEATFVTALEISAAARDSGRLGREFVATTDGSKVVIRWNDQSLSGAFLELDLRSNALDVHSSTIATSD